MQNRKQEFNYKQNIKFLAFFLFENVSLQGTISAHGTFEQLQEQIDQLRHEVTSSQNTADLEQKCTIDTIVNNEEKEDINWVLYAQ